MFVIAAIIMSFYDLEDWKYIFEYPIFHFGKWLFVYSALNMIVIAGNCHRIKMHSTIFWGVGVAKSLSLCEGALKMYDRSKGEQSDFKLSHMPHPRFVREWSLVLTTLHLT